MCVKNSYSDLKSKSSSRCACLQGDWWVGLLKILLLVMLDASISSASSFKVLKKLELVRRNGYT